MGTPPVPAIVGPTASGKTAIAIDVARELGGEIISMDSRQAYDGFAIGTAAPTAAGLSLKIPATGSATRNNAAAMARPYARRNPLASVAACLTRSIRPAP